MEANVRMTRVRGFVVVACVLYGSGPLAAQSPDHERAIRTAYEEWVAAANAKDLERWARYLAPDPIFLPANGPALEGEATIRAFYTELFADPTFSFDCRLESVEVAGSEELAWATGHCTATSTDDGGRVSQVTTRWAKVWKRSPDGAWRCALNSWSPTAPE
jgi:uncharacterized protein (TIGR02246 family)